MNYLVLIDMQHDFVDGSLRNEEAIRKIPAIVNKIKNFVSDGITGHIMVTKDTHGKDYLGTLEGKNLPVVHCIKDSLGWELCLEVEEALRNKNVGFFYKPTFGSTEMAEYFKQNIRHDDTIEICGFCTDICVISNALLLRAACPNTPITVDASCCAGVTVEKHRAALEVMKSCQITVINED